MANGEDAKRWTAIAVKLLPWIVTVIFGAGLAFGRYATKDDVGAVRKEMEQEMKDAIEKHETNQEKTLQKMEDRLSKQLDEIKNDLRRQRR